MPALTAAAELSAKEFNNILRLVIAETAPVWASIVSTGFLVLPKISSTIFLLSPFKKEISNSFEPALCAKLFPVKKSGSFTNASESKFLGALAVLAILFTRVLASWWVIGVLFAAAAVLNTLMALSITWVGTPLFSIGMIERLENTS